MREMNYHPAYQKSEFGEAWDRIREYYHFVRDRPKSTRTDLEEVILQSYREVLWKWAEERSRPIRVFVWLCCRLTKILGPFLVG